MACPRGWLVPMGWSVAGCLPWPRSWVPRFCRVTLAREIVPQATSANLAKRLRGDCDAASIFVRMSLVQSSGTRACALLVWPLNQPAAVFETETAAPPATRGRGPSVRNAGLLSRVKLGVSVVVAQKREAVCRIVQLAPGDVLQFDKSHRAPLELHVDGRRVAAGQCVEIGRRLGLVITSS